MAHKELVWFLGLPLIWIQLAMATAQETEVEINLCNLLKHTPNYAIYRLEEHSNCIAHVKSYGKLICLRDGDNKIIKEACFEKRKIEILATCAQVLTTSNKNTTSPSPSPSSPSFLTPSPSLSSFSAAPPSLSSFSDALPLPSSLASELSSDKISLNAFAIDAATLGLKTFAPTGTSSQFASPYSRGIGSQSVSKADKDRQPNESVEVVGSVKGLESLSTDGGVAKVSTTPDLSISSLVSPGKTSWALPGSEISVNARLTGQLIGLKIDLTSSESDEKETEKSKLISNFPETFTVTVPAISDSNLKTNKNNKTKIRQENETKTQSCSNSTLSMN